jgi:hypothetical protein
LGSLKRRGREEGKKGGERRKEKEKKREVEEEKGRSTMLSHVEGSLKP